MLAKAAVASTILWSSAVAAPSRQPHFKPSDQKITPARGELFHVNGTSPATDLEIYSAESYSLRDSYDASNWFSKFSVQKVC